MTPQPSGNDSNPVDARFKSVACGEREVLNEEAFQRMIASRAQENGALQRNPFCLCCSMLAIIRLRKRTEGPRQYRACTRVIHQGNRRNRLVQRPG